MPAPSLLNKAQQLADGASAKAEEFSGLFGSAESFILEHFGQNGLYAAYIAGAVLILFVISRLAKLGFNAIKYLVVPSVALAFVASFFLPFSFAAALPVSVTVCSLFLLFKG